MSVDPADVPDVHGAPDAEVPRPKKARPAREHDDDTTDIRERVAVLESRSKAIDREIKGLRDDVKSIRSELSEDVERVASKIDEVRAAISGALIKGLLGMLASMVSGGLVVVLATLGLIYSLLGGTFEGGGVKINALKDPAPISGPAHP